MFTADQVWSFLGQMVAFGGGGAVIGYLLFQYLGKAWIENKFAERLDQLRHQQALELQKLRVEIDSLLSGAIKLQEKEFAVLPEAWAKLDEAHGLVAWLVAPYQEYADVQRMNSTQLEEFLAGTEFTPSQKDEIRKSGEKGDTYREILFLYRLQKVRKAFGELQTFVARNGIFLPRELKDKFAKIAEVLWAAIVSKQVGHEAKDWKMQNEGWKRIQEETEPLYKSIEADIQARLQSHGRKPQGMAAGPPDG
jgi:hypothetical protein